MILYFIFYFTDKYSANVEVEIKSFKQDLEINTWIEENIDGECSRRLSMSGKIVCFWFSRRHEAILFKLVWGGK